MNNIMKLADAYKYADVLLTSIERKSDSDMHRAALEAAVAAQEKQIEQLTKQYESLRIAYGLMHGGSK